jgi:inosine-uridine nucleoside N-ribohydrolase
MIFKLYIDNDIGPDGATALAPALSKMTQLYSLSLGRKLL